MGCILADEQSTAISDAADVGPLDLSTIKSRPANGTLLEISDPCSADSDDAQRPLATHDDRLKHL